VSINIPTHSVACRCCRFQQFFLVQLSTSNYQGDTPCTPSKQDRISPLSHRHALGSFILSSEVHLRALCSTWVPVWSVQAQRVSPTDHDLTSQRRREQQTTTRETLITHDHAYYTHLHFVSGKLLLDQQRFQDVVENLTTWLEKAKERTRYVFFFALVSGL
jgi:hypothetical protein